MFAHLSSSKNRSTERRAVYASRVLHLPTRPLDSRETCDEERHRVSAAPGRATNLSTMRDSPLGRC
jgi:hypothetical protein